MAGLLQNKPLLCDDIPWINALRQKGRMAFEAQGVPTAKTEYWQYTKPRDLNADDFVMQNSEDYEFLSVDETHDCHCGKGEHECHCHHGEHECHCGNGEHECLCHASHEEGINLAERVLPFEAYYLYFANGMFIPMYPALPAGVEVKPLAEAIFDGEAKEYLGKLVDIEKHPFAALNTAYGEEGLFLRLQNGVKLDKPIVIWNHSEVEDENVFYNLRNLIVLEKGAKAEIFEYFDYKGKEKSRYFANCVNEVFLAAEASLHHYKLQDEAFKANHVALTVVRAKREAKYQNFCFQHGANIGRNEVVVQLAEEQAMADVSAAYKMAGWATLDFTTDIEHMAANTFSDQLVKGVIDSDARGVFQGKIKIHPDCVGSEGHQLHKAILLSDTAEADVKPELKIYADDVKCSHGAATGELDENQLFYMQSRGIDADEARRILVEAFLDDVLLKIENEDIRAYFKSKV